MLWEDRDEVDNILLMMILTVFSMVLFTCYSAIQEVAWGV